MARSLSPSLLQLQQALLAGVRRVHCKTGFSETLNATLLTTWGLQRGQPWAQKWKTSCCLWLSSPVARIQFWQLAILQTTDIFICVCIIDYLPYRHTFPQNMSYNFHITCVIWLPWREVEVELQTTRLASFWQQFKSAFEYLSAWNFSIFFKPLDISSHVCCDKNLIFWTGRQTRSAAVFKATNRYFEETSGNLQSCLWQPKQVF